MMQFMWAATKQEMLDSYKEELAEDWYLVVEDLFLICKEIPESDFLEYYNKASKKDRSSLIWENIVSKEKTLNSFGDVIHNGDEKETKKIVKKLLKICKETPDENFMECYQKAFEKYVRNEKIRFLWSGITEAILDAHKEIFKNGYEDNPKNAVKNLLKI